MPLKQLRLPGLLLAAFLCAFNFCFAQDYKKIEHRIDSLAKKGLYKSALTEINKLDELAWKNKNATEQIKGAMYYVIFLRYADENPIAKVIDTLKKHEKNAGFPVRPVLQSLLGQLYWTYYQQNRWQLSQRSRLEKPGNDITKWDLQTIVNESSRFYQLSLEDAKAEQQIDLSKIEEVLIGDKTLRYLRPTLYDLLVQRALDFFLAEEPALTKPKLPFSLNDDRFFSDSRTFSQLAIKTTDTSSTFYQGIKYVQQATIFHLQKPDDEALAALDLQRFKFLFNYATHQDKDTLYLNAIKHIATSFSSKPISAEAQLLIGGYYQRIDSLKLAVAYFNNAMSSYPQSFGAKNAAAFIKIIQHPELSAQVEDLNIPDKPLLGLLRYQNIKTARVTVYKVSLKTFNATSGIRSPIRYNNGRGAASVSHPLDSVYRYLRQLIPIQDGPLNLTGYEDYKTHSAEFKINPLTTGQYILVVRDNLSDDSTLMSLTTFRVSRLAFESRRIADSREEVKVMDRASGAPVPVVKVTIGDAERITDTNGSAIFDINANSFSLPVLLTTETDTLAASVYSLNQFNVLNTSVSRTIIFTDRQLYRPGQIVYYKGLQVQVQYGKSKILPGTSLTLSIRSNNGKPISSANVQTNDFGTFSGSFIIPQNILNGTIFISTPNGNKMIRVEGYKRPSFQAEFLPVKESYHPSDTVTLKGIVTAYSGYGLSMANVAYHINYTILFKDYRRFQSRVPPGQNMEFISDTVKTDSQGRFTIKFKAKSGDQDSVIIRSYNYNITANVTDRSGESRPVSANISIGNNNIQVITGYQVKVSAADSLTIGLRDLGYLPQAGSIKVDLYALQAPETLFKSRVWITTPDQFLIGKDEFKNNFPDYAYRNEDDQGRWPVKDKVADTLMRTDGTPAVLSWGILRNKPTGSYKMVIHAKNQRGDTLSQIKYVYLVNEPGKPSQLRDWVNPLVTNIGADNTAKFLVGIGKPVNVLIEKHDESQILSSQWIKISGGKQQLINVPVKADEKNVIVSFLMIYQNRDYRSVQNIQHKVVDDNLDIKFLTFRDKLQPGEKEQWKLQVSGKNNERPAAEMVANLYDVSLDAIGGRDSWYTLANSPNRIQPQRFYWDGGFVIPSTSVAAKLAGYLYFTGFVHNYESLGVRFAGDPGQKNIKGDRNADVTIDEPVGSSSAQVTEQEPNKIFTAVDRGTPYMMQELPVADPGAKNLKSVNVRLNGKDFAGGDPANAMKNLSADVVQDINSYGDQASITPRTNFAEIAFFYPELHTNEKGEILIDFTIPESLTKWRFRAFAHTKDLKTGYIEKEIVTQKQLSISANMPRFFREGDTITVSARLANLTKDALKGKVQLQLFNGLNMQPVSLLADAKEANQNFDIAGTATKAVSFKLIIPAGLDVITYRLTAAAGKFADGEENTFPVLPNRMLVTESMPMMVRAGQTRSFTFDKLVNQTSNTLKNKTLTLEYTQNPAWYAVQALPYMMEFPYECSEQTFSRYYANSMATNLVNRMPVIKQVFSQWKAANSTELLSSLEKNQELKSTLIEETPWLRDAASESEQKKSIALLFDLNKMSYELQINLDKLKQKQLADGGFPWFGGNRSDRYITQYILCGIGQLYHLNIADTKNLELKGIADRAIDYLDKELISDQNQAKKIDKDYKKRSLNAEEIHAYYTQSFFVSRQISPEVKSLTANYLTRAESQWVQYSPYEQGMIALTMLRNKKPEVAKMIIRSLLETAQQSDELGMYWAKNKLGYYWYQSPVETQGLLIELFTEAGNNDKAVEEMKIWLLRNKQTTNWKTTKATAAACYALLMKGDNWLAADAGQPNIKLNGKDLNDLKPGIKADAGTGYIKINWVDEQVQPGLGKVVITNTNKTVNWGALHWQYLENLDKITPSQTGVQLERKYFIKKQTDAGEMLTAVDAAHQPKIGDLLKVVVYLKADRDFEYIQLKDMRPAGTEPVDALSGYKYQDGLSYYQVTKDVATNFFISNLNKGNYVFEYSLRVAQSGNFSTGITTMQSMYAPEFNTHSEGRRLSVKP